jgi:hypothetical protein
MSVGRERLEYAWGTLQRQWDRTGEQWQDAVHDRFQREFWEEYERVVPAALKEIGHLEQVIAQIQREVP